MDQDTFTKIFGAGGVGGALFLLYKGLGLLYRRLDASVKDGEASTQSRQSMLDFLQQQLKDQQAIIESLRRESSDAGKFAARAEILATQVQEMAKLAAELKADAATLRAELEQRDITIERLRLRLVRAGIPLEDVLDEVHAPAPANDRQAPGGD